jgi:cellobiose phosphorylase
VAVEWLAEIHAPVNVLSGSSYFMTLEISRDHRTLATWQDSPSIRLENQLGLRIYLWPNGTMGSIEHEGTLINQMRGVPPEGAPFCLWWRDEQGLQPLLNPERITGFVALNARQALWEGSSSKCRWRVLLSLEEGRRAWSWHVQVRASTEREIRGAAILAQDLGLADVPSVRLNENYNAHYIDYQILEHGAWGRVVCARQNLRQSTGHHPWLAVWSSSGATEYATDGMDVFGLEQRICGVPRLAKMPLPSYRRQGESACAALATVDRTATHEVPAEFSFHMQYLPDHPEVTRPSDLDSLVVGVQPSWPSSSPSASPIRSIWDEPDLLNGNEFDAAEWDLWFPNRREEERIEGRLASFFMDDNTHVVARGKEAQVERSHGHILYATSELLPVEDALGCTVYAPGIFGAQLYAGSSSFSRVTTVVRDSLHRLRSSGTRIWVELDGGWKLLGMPSAFAMTGDVVTWWYSLPGCVLRVEVQTEEEPSAIVVEACVLLGSPVSWRMTLQLAMNDQEMEVGGSMEILPERREIHLRSSPGSLDSRYAGRYVRIAGHHDDVVLEWFGDEAVWSDRQSRGAPYAVSETAETKEVVWRIDAVCPLAARPSVKPALPHTVWRIKSGASELMTLAEILPWFRHDAWIHLATPHGLEQYGGGAWGVRDVCQGPVEWLLSEQRYAEVREILRVVFAQQNAEDGLWPQWFMLGRYSDIRQRHCHGDVMFWPLKALCDYAAAANDPGIVHLPVPFIGTDGKPAVSASLMCHIEKVLSYYHRHCVGGTALVSYGDGDWDDTLQPAQPSMRQGMVSAWTVGLAYQTFGQLAELCCRAGLHDRSETLAELQARILVDVRRHLMPDGVIAGFARYQEGQFIPLVHPRDTLSGIRYRLLPMTRGIIGGMFAPTEAMYHRDIIRRHLRFPDGVRLMDHPVTYRGGVCQLFQRAETSAYFGREVALQYVHAHLRYAEAMAGLGDAQEVWWALQMANPIGLTGRLPSAAPRQSNVYFSSSDGDCRDRHEAARRFDELRGGTLPVKAGWRLYSSGPGIYLHKVRSVLLGIRERYDDIHIDPMLPTTLLPCIVQARHEGRAITLSLEEADRPGVLINGKKVPFTPANYPYRTGGMVLNRRVYQSRLGESNNHIRICVARTNSLAG